jgi:hypothetical protein
MDDQEGVGLRVPVGSRILLLKIVQDDFPIQWVPGATSPGVRRQGLEADHSPPTSVGVKKTWICTSTPPTSPWRNA